MKLIRYLLLLLLITFPLGQLTRITLSNDLGISFYIHDLTIVALVISWLFVKIKTHLPFTYLPIYPGVITFILAGIISLLFALTRFNYSEVLISSLYLLRWVLYFMVYVVMTDYIKQTKENPWKWYFYLFLTGLSVAVIGLVQYILYPNLRNLLYLGWDPHQFRLFSLYFDPNYTGLLLSCTLIVLLTLLEMKYPVYLKFRMHHLVIPVSIGNLYKSMFTLICLLVLVSSIALTLSRSTYISLLAGLSIFYFVINKKKLLIPLIVFFGIIIAVLSFGSTSNESINLSRVSTINSRIENYRYAVSIIKQSLPTGVGFNTLRFYYVNSNSPTINNPIIQNHSISGLDSSLLFVLATTGILGLVGYSLILFKIIQFEYNTNKNKNSKYLRALILSTLTMVIVHSLFTNSLFFPWILLWFWMLWGIRHGSHNFS